MNRVGDPFLNCGRRAQAIAAYKRSLKLNPSNGDTATMLKSLRE